MLLASEGVEPPKIWSHDPGLQNKDGYTVAMWLTYKKVFDFEGWDHDPTL